MTSIILTNNWENIKYHSEHWDKNNEKITYRGRQCEFTNLCTSVQTYLKLTLKIIKLKIRSYFLLFACQSGLRKEEWYQTVLMIWQGYILDYLIYAVEIYIWKSGKYTGKALMYLIVDFFRWQLIITFLYFYLSSLFFHLFPFLLFFFSCKRWDHFWYIF